MEYMYGLAGASPSRMVGLHNDAGGWAVLACRRHAASGEWVMDRGRFDALARLLVTKGSRRATLGTLLGVGLLGHDPEALAKPGKSRGKDRQRRKKRRRKNNERGKDKDNDGGQSPPPPPAGGGKSPPPPPPPPPIEECCGTQQCAPPEVGSDRAGCNYAGQSFAGQDLSGAIFRHIDGRRANFANADVHGATFAGACLQEAIFSGAKLAGTAWDDACLVAADFTGADLGGNPALLDGAVLCGTIMPDGARNDRDCTREMPCCLSARGGPQTCGPCVALDQCHDAGICSCTIPTAPNGTTCSDGNPLCIGGVCCTDGREAVHGGCFVVTERGSSTRCNRETCDGSFGLVDGTNSTLCGKDTFNPCRGNEECPVGQACFLGQPFNGCITPC